MRNQESISPRCRRHTCSRHDRWHVKSSTVSAYVCRTRTHSWRLCQKILPEWRFTCVIPLTFTAPFMTNALWLFIVTDEGNQTLLTDELCHAKICLHSFTWRQMHGFGFIGRLVFMMIFNFLVFVLSISHTGYLLKFILKQNTSLSNSSSISILHL